MYLSGRATQRGPVLTPGMVWGRAAVLGTVAYASGVISHAIADGLLPGPFAMALLWATCVLGSTVTLLVRASALRIVAVVLAGQAWVHAVLSVAGHRGDQFGGVQAPVPTTVLPGTSSGGPTLLERFRTSQEATPPLAQDDWLAHQIDHFTSLTPAMLTAHLGGAAAMGLFLAVGESALWNLLALAAVRADARSRERISAACATVLSWWARATRRVVGAGPQVQGSQVWETGAERGRAPPFVLAA